MKKLIPSQKTKLVIYFVICAMCLAMFTFFFVSIFLEITNVHEPEIVAVMENEPLE